MKELKPTEWYQTIYEFQKFIEVNIIYRYIKKKRYKTYQNQRMSVFMDLAPGFAINSNIDMWNANIK